MQDPRWPTFPPRNITLDCVVPDGKDPSRGSLRVRDTEGREYLDAINGIGCLPLGHAHPKWIAAIEDQMRKLVAAAATFYTEPQQAFAAEVVRRAPVKDGRVFIGNTGTEVTEASLKIATRATKRDVVIAFDRAFHGRTFGSIALTAKSAYRHPYVSILGEPDELFARMNVARATYGDLDAVAKLFSEYSGRVAMVCVEPIQGEGGIHPASKDFLLGLKELCEKNGACLGLDEIQSGSGRTGDFSAWTTICGDVDADIVWYAKAIGGGFPISAVVAKAELAEQMGAGSHGSTFGGNPLACAAGLATLRIMDEEKLLDSARNQLPTVRKIAEERPIPAVKEVRGLGAMIGIELGDADLAGRTVKAAQEEGLLVVLSGGTAVRWLFPFRAAQDDLREAWERLSRAVAKAG